MTTPTPNPRLSLRDRVERGGLPIVILTDAHVTAAAKVVNYYSTIVYPVLPIGRFAIVKRVPTYFEKSLTADAARATHQRMIDAVMAGKLTFDMPVDIQEG